MFNKVNDVGLEEAALHYAANGIPVFPLQPREKKPLQGSHGFKDATTDAELIREQWKHCPDCNIGIATGAKAGFLVLDVDGSEGESSLAEIVSEYGELPATAQSHTGRGRHILFQDDGAYGNSASMIGHKLDVRAGGGYIVAPPSIHPNGNQYRWEQDGPIAAPPDWFQRKTAQPPKKHSRDHQDRATNSVAEGGRNAAVTSFAGTLRKKGIDGVALLEHLLAYNLNVCAPPLPEREIKSIADSISKYRNSEHFALTDHGNALRFVDLHGDKLRYVEKTNVWLNWKGTHWDEVTEDAVLKLAYDVPAAIDMEMAVADDAAALRKHALKTQSRARLEAIVKLARPMLAINVEILDRNPMLLSVRNGQIDLSSGALTPHCPDDFITKHVDIDFDINAKRDRWDRFMDQITSGDRDLVDFLQRIGGYCLTGLTREQVLFVFYGHGANGKSTFLEVLRSIMGPYASKTPMTTFLSLKGEKPSNDLARLRGTRFVSAVEVARGDRLNEPLLKELTGGDTVTARLLFKEFFEYKPQFKIIMSVNDLPRVEAGDEAINRRLIVVPFRATFNATSIDQHLSDKLREERSGILSWLVAGSVAWNRDGLKRPAAVKSATDGYLSSNDPLGEFLVENCVEGDGRSVSLDTFFRAYAEWAKETYGLEVYKFALGRLMAKKGIASKSRKGQRYYAGVSLKAVPQ